MTRDRRRAQTLQDYVAGISVFVLTIAVVLGLLPTVLAPFQGGVEAADATAAGRIGDQLVGNLSAGGAPNVLDATALSAVVAADEGTLQTRFGLPSHRHVNLSLRTLDGSAYATDPATGDPLTSGGSAAGEDAASAARIVSVNATGCDPACRLVVEVW